MISVPSPQVVEDLTDQPMSVHVATALNLAIELR
jgi:hypothetical protein